MLFEPWLGNGPGYDTTNAQPDAVEPWIEKMFFLILGIQNHDLMEMILKKTYIHYTCMYIYIYVYVYIHKLVCYEEL